MKKTISMMILSLTLASSLILSSCGNAKASFSTNETKMPVNQEVVQKIKVDKLSATVKPQDDFYEYVNQDLIKEKKTDEENPSWDNFGDVQEKIKNNVNGLIEELGKNEKVDNSNNSKKVVFNLYKTALDNKTKEKVGLGSLKTYIDSIKASKSIPEYLESIAKIQKELGSVSLFNFATFPDPKNSSKYALILDEPTLLAKKEDMESEDTQKDAKKYLKTLLTNQGMKEEESKKWSEKILNFQKDIAKNSYSKKEKNNIEKTLNYFKVVEIQAKISNANISKFLKESGREGYSSWLVMNPNIMPVINKYLTSENLELLKNYSVTALLNDYAPYLDNKYSAASAEFDQISTDEKDIALEAVKKIAEPELGELYVKKHFSPEKREAVTKLVKDIVKAYKKHIETLTWMSKESKAGAIKKLDTLSLKIGYPDNIGRKLSEDVVKPVDKGGSLIENVISINKLKAEKELKKATSPVDRNEWGLSPQILNGYYDHSSNEIVIPAAILQPPFYNEKASYAQNLGAIGAIIGHEITHAFDDNGSHYDEKGNYNDWWTKEDRAKFKEQAKKVVEHFGNIEVLPGHKLDGELTLGENIADTGGVSVASSILGNDKKALKDFFISYARLWATKTDDESLKQQILGDEHAPSKVRVNGVLRNIDAFYKAFDVKEGDKMFIKPENRVRMY